MNNIKDLASTEAPSDSAAAGPSSPSSPETLSLEVAPRAGEPSGDNEEHVAEVVSGEGDAAARALALLSLEGEQRTLPAGTGAGGVGRDPVRVFLAGYGREKTRRVMQQALDRIAIVTGVPTDRMAWSALRYPHTSAIHARLAEHGYARNTVRVTLSALSRVLETCWRLGLTTHEEYRSATAYGKCQGVRLEEPGRALSRDEVVALVAYARAQRGPYGAFVRCFLALALGGGLRADELGAIAPTAYERTTAGGVVHVLGKGAKAATVLLGRAEAAEIEGWLRARAVLEPRTERLLLRVSRTGGLTHDGPIGEQALHKVCAELAAAVGIPSFAPHDLRRTYATRLYEAGLSDSVVAKLMRHANAATTRRYDRRTQSTIDAARMGVNMWPENQALEQIAEKRET